MGLLTSDQLKQIMPTLTAAKRDAYIPWLNFSMARYGINNEDRISMYLAQLAHESLNLTRWTENLNYSVYRLVQVWPRRFPTVAAAAPYAMNPKALADKVYNGRMGNRVGTDDGYIYRGAGPLQATGRDMFQQLTDDVGGPFGVDFVKKPELLLQPKWGFLSSAYIFAIEKRCLPMADRRDIVACTKAINGGTTGLAERKAIWERALRVMPDGFQLDSFESLSDTSGPETPSDHHDLVPNEPDPDPEPTDNNIAQPDPEPTANNSAVKIGPDGTIEASSSSDGKKDVIAIEKPAPKNFIQEMRAKIGAAIGGNVTISLISEKIQEFKSLGLPEQFAAYTILIVAIGTVIWLLVETVKWILDRHRDQKITDSLISANSTATNVITLVDTDKIAAVEAAGATVVRR